VLILESYQNLGIEMYYFHMPPAITLQA